MTLEQMQLVEDSIKSMLKKSVTETLQQNCKSLNSKNIPNLKLSPVSLTTKGFPGTLRRGWRMRLKGW